MPKMPRELPGDDARRRRQDPSGVGESTTTDPATTASAIQPGRDPDQTSLSATGPPAGWYLDPAGSGNERWWDGANWGEQLRSPQAPVQQAQAPGPAPPPHLLDKPIKGQNGNLILGVNSLTITRGVKGGLLTGYSRGDKVIPYSSVVAVQFKKSGALKGYIQLSLRGGSEAKGGISQAGRDENTITFIKNSSEFGLAARFLQSRIA